MNTQKWECRLQAPWLTNREGGICAKYEESSKRAIVGRGKSTNMVGVR